jgi:hypothetical protein
VPEVFDLVEYLIDAAVATARRRRERIMARDRVRRRLALQPGPETPLWNELVRQIRPHLRKRGSKAQLARLLCVPRQRLQACLKARYACLDAERTLLLVGWLGFFQRGGELIPSVRPGRPRRAWKGKPSRTFPGNL